jgi:hypothetical protein
MVVIAPLFAPNFLAFITLRWPIGLKANNGHKKLINGQKLHKR